MKIDWVIVSAQFLYFSLVQGLLYFGLLIANAPNPGIRISEMILAQLLGAIFLFQFQQGHKQ